MTNETLETLKNRRSCRAYLPKQITEEELDAVLEAGTYAPTAKGLQSPRIVVIQDEATRAKLSAMNAAVMGSTGDPMYGAPTYLLVIADAHRPTAQQDGSLVMGNLMNAAASLGLGSCWINRAREMFDTQEGKDLLAAWGIQGDWEGVGFCILGLPRRPAQAGGPPQGGLHRPGVMGRKDRLPTAPALPAGGQGLVLLEGPEGAARLYALAGAEDEGAGLWVRGADLSGEELDGLTLSRCLLEDCRLTGAGLRKAALTDCIPALLRPVGGRRGMTAAGSAAPGRGSRPWGPTCRAAA